MNIKTIANIAPYICMILLFILLMFVTNQTQSLIDQRDKDWGDLMRECKCMCPQYKPMNNYNNTIPMLNFTLLQDKLSQ